MMDNDNIFEIELARNQNSVPLAMFLHITTKMLSVPLIGTYLFL
jgi:hypothetical protein